MSKKEIKQTLTALATAQGSYGRIVQEIEERQAWGALHELCKKNGIKTPVDLILFIEC